MKMQFKARHIALATAGVLAFSLSACGSSTDDKPGSDPENGAEEVSTLEKLRDNYPRDRR